MVSGLVRRCHFVDLVFEVINGQSDQAAHLVQGFTVGFKDLMLNIRIRLKFDKVIMGEDMMQLVLFNQIPTTFDFHGHLLNSDKGQRASPD